MDYYGDNDRSACAWLRELVKEGLIPDGTVEERDIQDLGARDLAGFRRVHLFAGIGGWAYAFELAGWPRERPVWSGSCPCQPFSAAGKRKGQADERHLWPVFLRLIRECRPATVFGEQVASDDGYRWLARVRDDLEAAGYAVGCADLPACSQGAPMVSQRLHWVATSNGNGFTEGRLSVRPRRPFKEAVVAQRSGKDAARLAAPNGNDGHWWSGPLQVGWNAIEGEVERGGQRICAQWRIKPGLSMLADGIPGRVDILSGYGNAIVPQVAAAFIRAFLEAEAELA